MSTQQDGSGYPGQLGVSVPNSKFNRDRFHIKQMLAKMQTVTLVQVVAVNQNSGGTFPAGTVDVQPLVNLIDGLGNTAPQGIIYGLPYFRLQGGLNAIILNPVVGDIGLAAFASRDISLVISQKAQANPGSRRKFSRSDGLYLGGFLNSASPTQLIAFLSNGIEIKDNQGNKIQTGSTGVNINGLLIDQSGNLTTPGGVQAGTGGADQVTLQTHKHPTAATGAPSSPTSGT